MITTKVMLVTPAIAEKWLKNNHSNRGISYGKVRMYAEEMRAGKWQLNGETISISETGKLKNGQHRLSAVILSGCSVKMMVVFGVSDDVSVYDRGRGRNVVDVLRLEGFPPTVANNVTVASVRLHYFLNGSIQSVSDDAIRSFLSDHYDDFETVYSIIPKAKKKGDVACDAAPFVVASLYAYKEGVPLRTIEMFLQAVQTGMSFDESHRAAIVFRNDVIGGNVDLDKRSRRKDAVHQIEKALYDFYKGIPRKQTYKQWKDPVFSKYNPFSDELEERVS